MEFFSEQVFSSTQGADNQVYARMTMEGFSSIISFFMLLNQTKKKIQRLLPQNPEIANNSNNMNAGGVIGYYPAVPRMTSYSNTTGGSYQNYSFNNKTKSSDEDHGFLTLVAPWELEGIEGVWKIAIEAVNRTVNEKASQMLIRLYTNPTFVLEERISEFEDAFIKHCLDQISEL